MESPVLVVLRFQKWNLSIQVGYHLTFSTEGNTVGKVVGWSGNANSRVEIGRSIRITHRSLVRNVVIRQHYCGLHYESNLKTERYDPVQVVLLESLTLTLPRVWVMKFTWSKEVGTSHGVVWYFVVQKITKPKTNHYFDTFATQNLTFELSPLNQIKQKCSSGFNERWLHSNEPFIAHKDRKSECILTKNL